jgi:hypothetical protein
VNIPKIFVTFFDKFKVPRYRDRRGHYASSALKDSRELYWELHRRAAHEPDRLRRQHPDEHRQVD